MLLDRRTFASRLSSLSALALASAANRNLVLGQDPTVPQPPAQAQTLPAQSSQASGPIFLATWNFGLPACQQSLKTLQQGGSMLDAIEQGIRVAEADPNVDSVGLGGAPNAQGVVQLDACIMDGKTQKAGSVAALENYPHPISVARRVMERTKHVLLVGQGAAQFAHDQGFKTANLLTAEQQQKWLQWQAQQAQAPKTKTDSPPNHDTIALVGLNADGHLAGGCSTSGLAYKMPGRVGDSPILGGGLYVDGEVGAAGATGIGENVMRYCGSFLIVELMRGGMDPTTACRTAIERIARLDRKPASELHINFLAIDKSGRYGAAGTDAGFQAALVTTQQAKLIQPELVG